MRRGAAVVAEDRVLAVLAFACVATVSAVEPAREVEPPVPAPCGLKEVAGDRAHVPELWRRREPAGLAQRVRYLRARLELGQRRSRADPRPVDAARNQPADVDQPLDLHEPVAHERHELGPARERERAVPERGARLVEARRPQELHAAPSPPPPEAPAEAPHA